MGKDSSRIKTRKWIISAVSMILRREAYIGVAEQLKRTVISYRNQKEVKRPKEEHIRVENVFPMIIDRETWDAVQEVNRAAREPYANRAAEEKSVFSGLLVCADCGVTMNFNTFTKSYESGARVTYTNAKCRTFQATGGTSCSSHAISGNALHKLVGNHIRQMAEQVALDEGAMRESLRQRLIAETAWTKADTKQEIKALTTEIYKLEVEVMKRYEEWAEGEISEEMFTDLIGKNEAARQEKEQRRSLLEQSGEEAAAKEADIECWMRLVREYAAVGVVEREMLEALVERIEVGEKYVENGRKHQDIRVFFKFVGLC